MPHYSNGSKIKLGDIVYGESINKGKIIGVVIDIFTNRDKCNLKIAFKFKDIDNVSTHENCTSIWDLKDQIRSGGRYHLMVTDSHLMTDGSISQDNILVSSIGGLMDFNFDYGNASSFVKVSDIIEENYEVINKLISNKEEKQKTNVLTLKANKKNFEKLKKSTNNFRSGGL